MLPKYKKTTDVQQTWRQHGWRPPSEDPAMIIKWRFFRTLDTEQADVEVCVPNQGESDD
jgi:hypothetical protein